MKDDERISAERALGSYQQNIWYLEGQGDLISRLIIMGITSVIVWVIGVANILTKCSCTKKGDLPFSFSLSLHNAYIFPI